jgi:cytochrome c peroxidase
MQLRTRVFAVSMAAFGLSACGQTDDQNEDVTLVQGAINQTFAQHQTVCQADPRVQSGVVSLTECIGADIFFKENFNGNGRTCGTCHRVERNFAIDATFIARLPSSDPLFIAENHSDPFALDQLEIPAQMRARSLILENVDGTQPEGPTKRFVLRAVPHTLSQGISTAPPPGSQADRTGWGGDGAPGQGRLADFTNGAINQHFTRSLNRVAGTDFRVATEAEGQAVATFMRAVGRTNDIDLASIRFTDAGADAGRVKFINGGNFGCFTCHGNATANASATSGNTNQFTNVESVRNPALDAAMIPIDGGFGGSSIQPPSGPIGDGTFNVPPVIEAADSGPFFHTDTQVIGAPSENTSSAQTIEQAVAFYNSNAFQLNFTATEIANVARFLRAINAVFNIQMASNRIIGARNMANALGNVARVDRMQRRMAQMTLFELDDAVRVLSQVNLNPAQANRVRTARGRIQTVIATTGTSPTAFNTRMLNLANAFNDLDLADGEISANVSFNIGNGTRIDCADPSTDGQPGNAACFDPALRTAAP